MPVGICGTARLMEAYSAKSGNKTIKMRTAKQVKIKTKDYSPPPGSKKRGRIKDEPEPMVIIPAVPAESVAQYSLSLPSANKDRMLDEMDMLRNITENLNKIVSTMEGTYTKDDQTEEEGEYEEEEPGPSKDVHEDMTSFLICCSHLSAQLEKALHEEKQILESLLKWFEKEVHEMEEIGEEQLIPDWQIPLADKNITDNISKLLNRIQRLEELKGRVQELPKLIQLAAPKPEKKRPVTPVAPTQKDPRNIIEELAMKHATEDVMNMVQVFQDDSGQPQTIESMNNRMVEIMKVFERQTNKLHRVANEQDVLEGKLQKIQQEFRKLAEEKEIMEDELQKMKASEVPEKMGPDARKKMLQKVEKAKTEEKPPHTPAERAQPFATRQKEQQKMKEDLAKAQANIQSLENEKKMLEEKLKKALEEAEMAKGQLAEIPPTIPDWQFPYTKVVEDEKDIPKKGKKAKSKGKGEDRTDLKQLSSGIDKAVHKLQKDTGAVQDHFTAPELKDVKQKKRLSGAKEKEPPSVMEKVPKQVSQSEMTSRITDKKEEAKKKLKTEGKSETIDSKGVPKSETAEIKRGRSIIKGTGKDVSLPIQEKEQLPDSTEIKEALPVTLDTSPEETLPPDSKRRKSEIMISPEFGVTDSLSSEQKVSPLPEFHVEESAELETIMGVSETKPVFGMTVTPEPIEKMEGIPAVDTSRKILTAEEGIPIDSLQYREVETEDSINKKMLQLADHLKQLEGIPQAETLAKLLVDPGKVMDEFSDRQKLQLLHTLNQLITPDEIQQTGKEEDEKKRKLFENVVSTLQLLQQTEVPEADQSEEEINEIIKKRRALLDNLESVLEGIQQTQSAAQPTQEDIDREINKLSEERSLLLASLESNMKDLEQAQALARDQPSEMNENKVKELLKQRELLTVNLEANQQALQRVKSFETGLTDKYKHGDKLEDLTEQRKHLTEEPKAAVTDIQEMYHPSQRPLFPTPSETELYRMYELSEKKQQLLEKLESTQKELQEAQELAATQPGSISGNKIEELTEQKKHLMEELKAAVTEIQEMHPLQIPLFRRPSEVEWYQMYKLSEKKQQLLEKLESNQKELQEAQELAATQPGSVSEQKLQELADQKKYLTAELESTLDEMQNIYHRASERTVFVPPVDREIDQLSARKKDLLEKLESNRKELQEAQELSIIKPGSISEHKLQELMKQRRDLTADLETTMHDLQKVRDFTSEGIIRPSGRHLYELSSKKQELLEKLESNQKELQEAQELAVTQPSSISEHKVQELNEQRKQLTKELEETLHDIRKAEHYASGRALIGRPAEKEMHDLSVKKQVLQEKLESNQKELEEARTLAASHPGSISEHKLHELEEQGRNLAADLRATVQHIQKVQQKVQHGVSERPQLELAEAELYELSAKKHHLQSSLESNWKALQEAQALAAIQPDSVNEHKLQELFEERRRLTKELKAAEQDLDEAECRASDRALIGQPIEGELYELSEMKQLLLENLKGLQELQALASTQPGIAGEMKLYELSEKKGMLLDSLASNRKELQEAQALADAQPGSISDHRLQTLNEQRRLLTEDLKTTVHDMQEIQHHALQRALAGRSTAERELFELSEKKQLLLESLQAKQKELQEAKSLENSQPGSISEEKLQELQEQKTRLTAALEATIHDIRGMQRHASHTALLGEPDEWDLHKLFQWKQLLLEHLESHLNEINALAATEPDSISEKKMEELNEQRKILIENLEIVVQDIHEMKAHISDISTERPTDSSQLLERKKWLLKHLEMNMKNLQAAQRVAASHPSSINEQKVQELIDERRLLAAGLEAVIQDLQDIHSLAQEEVGTRARKDVLEELSEKKRIFLKNLASNLKDLKEAQALAAAQPDGISEQKVQELTEQRRLLAVGLETIVREIQGLVTGKVEIMQPSEGELDKLSEKRRQFLENVELNLEEVKDLQAFEDSELHGMNEQKMQELAEKRALLAANFESFLQDMQEAQVLDQDQLVVARPDERKVNDLIELTRLETKLDELEEAEALSHDQLDSIRSKIQTLKQQKRSVIDKWEVPFLDGYPEAAYGVDKKDKEKAVKEFLEKRKGLFTYLQSSIRDLQQKGIIQQGFVPEKITEDMSEEGNVLDLMVVPIDLLQSEPDEKTVKRRALAAKLEANIKDLQAAFEAEKTRQAVIRRIKSDRTPHKKAEVVQEQQDSTLFPRIPIPDYNTDIKTPEIESNVAVQDQQDKSIHKEIESAFRRQHLAQQPLHKTSLPQLRSPSMVDVRPPVDAALQEILDYNKSLFPSHKANLQQALQIAQQQLQQQQAYMLAEKLRNISPQPPGTTRFHDYTLQPPVSGWESNQLPQKDYVHKLKMLKKKILGSEMKALRQASSPIQGPRSSANQDQEVDPIVICGKGVSPYRKHGAFPVIKQNLRHH